MRVGSYDLTDEIGRGANGRVFRARDLRTGAAAAVKLVTWPVTASEAERRETLARFHREVEVASKVRHPGIVGVREAGGDDSVLWIAMELVDGVPLASLPLPQPLRRVARLVEGLAAVLDHVHALGVVHRDISPENVIVRPGDEVMLLDFGVARVAGSSLTGTGEFLGSPHLLAPEQMRGEIPGPQADQFSLAVLAFHLLSGAWPYPGRDAAEIFDAALNRPPLSLLSARPELPPAVADAIARGIDADPARRHPSAGAFANALRGAVEAAAARQSRNRFVRVAAGTAVLAVTVAVFWVPWSREDRVVRLADAGSHAEVAETLRRWKAAKPLDPRLPRAEGHGAFARGAHAEGVEAYRRAEESKPGSLDDRRVLRNLEAAMAVEGTRSALKRIAPHLPRSFEPVLRRNAADLQYFRRWNAATMLEARGHEVDWPAIYMLDLEHAGSCPTRKAAAVKLGELRDRRALPALNAARNDRRNRLCFLGRALDEAEQAILAGGS